MERDGEGEHQMEAVVSEVQQHVIVPAEEVGRQLGAVAGANTQVQPGTGERTELVPGTYLPKLGTTEASISVSTTTSTGLVR